MQYITFKRARFLGISGTVNLPYNTHITAHNGYLYHDNMILCAVDSQNAHDYFAWNADGNGLRRGEMTQKIINILKRRDKHYQRRWDAVWTDYTCKQYKNKAHPDDWIWNNRFYAAPITDLCHMIDLITGDGGAKHCTKY